MNSGEPGPAAPAAPVADPARWVEEHGDFLFRFALSRVRDAVRAEDLVQETFLAGIKSEQRFEGRSAERGWLAGILKNKIADHFRRAARETSFTDLDFFEDGEEQSFQPDGLHVGSWQPGRGPLEWAGDPGQALDSAAFWEAFQDCSGKLPVRIALVFTLREVDGVESREICDTLGISESNLWVMLHRARMALRGCLESRWFGKE